MSVAIDITENGIEINGVAVKLPCQVVRLSDILGEPVKRTYGSVLSAVFDEKQTDGLTEGANYIWNELGIECGSDDGVTVDTIVLRLRNSSIISQPDYYASSMFSGTFTIDGKPWLKALEHGDSGMDCTELIIGEYSVYAAHADHRPHPFNKAARYSFIMLALEAYYNNDDNES